MSEDLLAKAAELEDLLARETFYRELPAIEQHASAIDGEYARRFAEALEARIAVYTEALDRLAHTPGWDGIDQEQQHKLAAPLERGKMPGTRSGCRFLSSALSWMLARPVFKTPSRSFTELSTVTVSRRLGWAATSLEESKRRNSSMPRWPVFGRSVLA